MLNFVNVFDPGVFFYGTVHGDVKGERDLVHVCDMVWLDFLFGNFVLAVSAEDGHPFFVILWHLLRSSSSCADGEMTPFHKTEAP